jgi:tetratricopeptide (TPR) repeat protein
MPEDVMLQQAIDALRNGQRTRSRDLLTRLLRVDQNNPQYWLWLSASVDTPKEQIYCLQSALKLAPNDPTIRHGLIVLGALPADPNTQTQPRLQPRSWQVAEQEIPKQSPMSNSWLRTLAFMIGALVFISLLVWAAISINASRQKPVAFIPTSTPGPTPIFTLTPTAIQGTRQPATPTPKPAGPLSLAQKLNLQYTPTPFYINTPHAANEAYRIALRSYNHGDFEEALSKFKQAAEMDPQAADIFYLIAEIYYAQEDFPTALKVYQKSAEIDPRFAPAYLGIARSRLAEDPEANVLEDLQKAIELDPQLALAHLDLIAYRLQRSEFEQAKTALEQSKGVLEQSALWYTYQAQVEIAQKKYSAAYQQAQQALELDQGLLPAYRIVGQTALLNEKSKEALSALEIYLEYETEDAQAWLWKGQALYEAGKYQDAIIAIDNALDIQSDLPEAHHYRGLAYLELNEGQAAVNDFLVALRGNTQSFSHHLNLGRALLAAERFGDARGQLNTCENLAETDEELAQVYYYRALASTGLENRPWAVRDWQALLALPKESAPQEWFKQAIQQLTPTPNSATSAASSKTSTAKPTGANIRTPTLTPTPKP